MNVLNFILFLIGGVIFVSSMFNCATYGTLFFDRNYFCIEKFRTVQKATDLISIIHWLACMMFAAFLIFYTVNNYKFNIENNNLIINVFWCSFGAVALDMIVSGLLITKHKMTTVRDDIMHQWKTQKHITKENNHEVNLYNGCKRVTVDYPKQTLFIVITLVIFNFFI